MKNFDFDTPVNRQNTASLKWDRYKDRDIIPLWVADLDFKSPPPVIDALHQRVEHGVFGYGVTPNELVEVVCAILADRYNWQIHPEWLVWLPGLVSGLNIACRSVGSEGDGVMSMIPVYPPFLTGPQHFNRQLIRVGLLDDGSRWVIDFELFEKSITDNTRLLLLCSPHNPVGRVFDKEELARLVSICEKYDIIICSDEIHCDLILDGDKQHIPTAAISPEAGARTITLMAPSKTFNIPGLGCSFAVISDAGLRQDFLKAMAGIVPEVNILGIEASLAAYRDGWEWHGALLDYLRENRSLVELEVGRMDGLAMNHVEATYLAWIDARSIDPLSPASYFEKAGVGLSEGSEFGSPGFVRLNFGCPRSLLWQALERMKQALSV
jgi:cystathionine beta-lyase